MEKICFQDNEFEIAVATYKRPEFIKRWLDKCYQAVVERNIRLSVYDSSPDDNTESYIEAFNKNKGQKVDYHRIDTETFIGYKPMIPILESAAEYLWVSGDSRYHDFDELDERVFPLIKNKSIDYAVINMINNGSETETVIDNHDEMLRKCFVSSTCIGMSIYRTAIFDPIKKDPDLKKSYDLLFANNFGFGWLGYFYSVYAMQKYRTALINVKVNNILKKKTQTWAVRFYGCWADDLCQIIDNIPDSYTNKGEVPKETWSVMNLDSFSYCYRVRKYGDLNGDKFDELERNGTLKRLSDNRSRIKLFAVAPMQVLDIAYFIFRVCSKGKRGIKKIARVTFKRK